MSHHSIHLRPFLPVAEECEPADRQRLDWNKVPVPSQNDFRHKYNTALVLMGSAQHPVFAHPKMLGRCCDNIYHQGHFIGDLPAQGKNPTEAQMKKIYYQEYEEVVAWIENSLDLSHQGMVYPTVPTPLLNLEIVLPLRVFQERCGLPEVLPGHVPQPKDYMFDGAISVSWEQWVPPIQPDDIDKDLLYNQYPYQQVDEYDDDEEELEVDNRMPGNARDACMAAPTGTQRLYQRLPASYATYTQQALGSP